MSGSNAAVAPRPWDARLALWLVRPLQGTRVRPNHLTTVRLAVGLAALACLANGWPNLGAWLFVLSNLLDHSDGELARLTGRTSRAGHLYDLATDALIHVLLFAAIGLGLESSGAAGWGLSAGIVAVLAVTAIFYLRHRMEEAHGKAATAQAAWFGFEAEDVLKQPLIGSMAIPTCRRAMNCPCRWVLRVSMVAWRYITAPAPVHRQVVALRR